jgi:hypothetical protein
MTTSEKLEARTPGISTLNQPVASVCSPTHTMSEAELDQHIKDCGELMKKAFAEDRPADGYQHMQNMYAAIRSRSPEHQARLIAKNESGAWFQSQEALDMGKES